jgi:hypothetical protein
MHTTAGLSVHGLRRPGIERVNLIPARCNRAWVSGIGWRRIPRHTSSWVCRPLIAHLGNGNPGTSVSGSRLSDSGRFTATTGWRKNMYRMVTASLLLVASAAFCSAQELIPSEWKSEHGIRLSFEAEKSRRPVDLPFFVRLRSLNGSNRCDPDLAARRHPASRADPGSASLDPA